MTLSAALACTPARAQTMVPTSDAGVARGAAPAAAANHDQADALALVLALAQTASPDQTKKKD